MRGPKKWTLPAGDPMTGERQWAEFPLAGAAAKGGLLVAQTEIDLGASLGSTHPTPSTYSTHSTHST